MLQLEMAELNLKQLRSANDCNSDNNGENNHDEEKSVLNKIENINLSLEHEELKKLNEAQRIRIEELTLYIQQAAEGLLLKLY